MLCSMVLAIPGAAVQDRVQAPSPRSAPAAMAWVSWTMALLLLLGRCPTDGELFIDLFHERDQLLYCEENAFPALTPIFADVRPPYRGRKPWTGQGRLDRSFRSVRRLSWRPSFIRFSLAVDLCLGIRKNQERFCQAGSSGSRSDEGRGFQKLSGSPGGPLHLLRVLLLFPGRLLHRRRCASHPVCEISGSLCSAFPWPQRSLRLRGASAVPVSGPWPEPLPPLWSLRLPPPLMRPVLYAWRPVLPPSAAGHPGAAPGPHKGTPVRPGRPSGHPAAETRTGMSWHTGPWIPEGPARCWQNGIPSG